LQDEQDSILLILQSRLKIKGENTMAHTVTKTTSYGTRVGNSFKAIGAGFIAFLIGTVILFWNEGRFVERQATIGELGQKAKHVDFDELQRINEDLEGKVIHASGFAETKIVLEDELFGVGGVAIALKRQVEYYQHYEKSREEKKDNLGGSETTKTTYTYPKDWRSSPVDSSTFDDSEFRKSNFVLTTVEAKSQLSTNVTFGAYRLPRGLVEKISAREPANATLTPALEKLNKELGGDAVTTAPPAPAAGLTPEQEMMQMELGLDTPAPASTETLQPATPASAAMVHVMGNTVYIGRHPGTPQVGDVRITLTKAIPTDVSLIAEVSGRTFQEYNAKKTGKDIWLFSTGVAGKASMIADAHKANAMWAWILRLVGTLCVIGGLKGIFGFITTLAKVIPFLATIIGAGIGLICFVVGLAWSLVIIALAWLTYRPMIGVPMLLVAIAGIWYLKKVAANKKNAQPAAEAAS